jgi:hypothetical protein
MQKELTVSVSFIISVRQMGDAAVCDSHRSRRTDRPRRVTFVVFFVSVSVCSVGTIFFHECVLKKIMSFLNRAEELRFWQREYNMVPR